MPLKEPQSMDECVYFTNRSINSGTVKAWVFKELCPKCGKALMGKSRDEKTGKVKIRADEYTCPECSYTIEKEEYESSLIANVKYICPYCHNQGELQLPFKRKKEKRFNEEAGKKETVESLRFQCQKCNKDIDITKKMK